MAICKTNEFGIFELLTKMTIFIKNIENYQYSGMYESTFWTRFFRCDVDLDSGHIFRSKKPAQQAFMEFVKNKGFIHILYTDGSVINKTEDNNIEPGLGAAYAVINQNMECLSAKRINILIIILTYLMRRLTR